VVIITGHDVEESARDGLVAAHQDLVARSGRAYGFLDVVI